MGKSIAITSYRKGKGITTVTALLAYRASQLGHKTLVVDFNQRYGDLEDKCIESIGKGLDELYHFIKVDTKSRVIVKNFAKAATDNFSVLSHAKATENQSDVISRAREAILFCEDYDFTVIDTTSGNNIGTLETIAYSDVVVVVVDQDQNHIKHLLSSRLYNKYTDKLVFVVNKYMVDDVTYNTDAIKEQISQYFSAAAVFELDFDPEILNANNSGKLVSRLEKVSPKTADFTVEQLDTIIDFIIKKLRPSASSSVSNVLAEGATDARIANTDGDRQKKPGLFRFGKK